MKDAAAWVHISEIQPWDRNISEIADADVEEAVASLLRFGFCTPMIGWGSRRLLVGGHARRLGVLEILRDNPHHIFPDAPAPGFVPIRWVEFSSDDEAAAYGLRDNNRIGRVDVDRAMAEIQRLQAAGTSLDDLGWDEQELRELAAAANAAGEDAGGESDDDDDDDIQDPKGDSSGQPRMQFRQWQLLMTDDDADRLGRLIREHVDTHGSTLGFVRRMLDGEL